MIHYNFLVDSPAISVINSPIGKIRIETVSNTKLINTNTEANSKLQVITDNSLRQSTSSYKHPKLSKRKLFSDFPLNSKIYTIYYS